MCQSRANTQQDFLTAHFVSFLQVQSHTLKTKTNTQKSRSDHEEQGRRTEEKKEGTDARMPFVANVNNSFAGHKHVLSRVRLRGDRQQTAIVRLGQEAKNIKWELRNVAEEFRVMRLSVEGSDSTRLLATRALWSWAARFAMFLHHRCAYCASGQTALQTATILLDSLGCPVERMRVGERSVIPISVPSVEEGANTKGPPCGVLESRLKNHCCMTSTC